MFDMYGYDVPYGHRGRLPDGTWILFPTRKEYEEMWNECLERLNSEQNLFQPGLEVG